MRDQAAFKYEGNDNTMHRNALHANMARSRSSESAREAFNRKPYYLNCVYGDKLIRTDAVVIIKKVEG